MLEIRAVGFGDLGGDAQSKPRPTRDLDRAIHPLFRRDTPHKGEVRGAGGRGEGEEAGGQAVVDGRLVREPRHGRALRVRDRHKGLMSEGAIDALDVGDVEPAVQRGDALVRRGATHEMQVLGVVVNQVVLVRVLCDLVEHEQVGGNRVGTVGVEPQPLLGLGPKRRRGVRVSGGVKGDLVAEPDEFLGQVGDDALRAAVGLGRDALEEG